MSLELINSLNPERRAAKYLFQEKPEKVIEVQITAVWVTMPRCGLVCLKTMLLSSGCYVVISHNETVQVNS